MNILHLSPFVPETRANHAGGVCMGRQLETLKENHNVTVLTFQNNSFEADLLKAHPDYQYIKTSKWTFIGNILLHPFMPQMFAIRSSRRYKAEVRKILKEKKIDAVHAEYTAMGQYAWIKKEYPSIQFNMTEHDVTYQSYQRQAAEAKGLKKFYLNIETKKVKKYEARYLKQADTVFAFNEKDGRLLQEIYGIHNIKVINPYYGVDFDQIETVEKISHSICFVGQMARQENHVAAMRLIKIFQQLNHPDYHLTIIGAHPQEELKKQECANIHITGFVADINQEIQKNEIAVFPLTYGAGIKLKVLLAFGLGLPVVTSAVGAEGIDPDGRVLSLAETDAEYIQQINALFSNPAGLRQKSEESRTYVRKNFNWEKTRKVFAEVYPVKQ